MHNQKIKGNLLLLLTAFIWGLSFISQSKGVEAIAPIAFNGIRSLLGGLVLLPVIFVLDKIKIKNNQPVKKLDKTLVLGGSVCGVLLCIATTLQTAGMVETSPGKAGFITALYMIIVPIISIIMGKRLNVLTVISAIIASCGLYFMCIPRGGFSLNHGDLLVFYCAFVFAVHILVIDHFSPKVDGVRLSCFQFIVCGVINLIWMFFDQVPSVDTVISSWASIGYAGIMSCGVAYTLQIVGQKYTDPSSASIIMSLESVFATLSTVVLIYFGWELTGGALSPRELWGCVLMFIAIILVQLPDTKLFSFGRKKSSF